MDVVYGLIGLAALVVVVWVVRSQGGSKAPAPEEVGPEALDELEAMADRAALGEALSEEELGRVDAIMGELYAYMSYFSGTEDNRDWRKDDQLAFFRAAIQAAATGHPRHNAWPVGAAFRTAILPRLELGKDADPGGWGAAAWLPVAVATGEHAAAVTAWRELEAARPELAQLALRWIRMGPVWFADSNDQARADAFVAVVGDGAGLAAPAPDLSPAQRWLLAACIYPDYGSDPRATLAAPLTPELARSTLARWWSVESVEEARQTLERLLVGMHNAAFHRAVASDGAGAAWWPEFVAAHPELDRERGIPAWDLCRGISVARTAVAADYLDEEEGWIWVTQLGIALRQQLHSWDDLAENYLLGEDFFMRARDGSSAHSALIRWLQSSADSPWRRVAFDLELAELQDLLER